ncbi:MAG TPA: minichromosome maintenance protein MCM [archaeon]|nr:minichromosome maintenance protein MCM [archaeon]HPV66019.1 minichromosome maintenance protein MCM [archaeon]
MTEFDFEEEFDESQNGKTNLALDEYISIFTDFLEAVYKKEIEILASNYPEKKSLDIDYKKLEAYDLNISERLIENPNIIIEAATVALRRIDVGILEQTDQKFEPHIRFFNLPEEYRVDIRDIGSKHLTCLVSAEGMIRQITERLQKMTDAHFICRKCQNSYNIKQTSQTLTKPVVCDCKSREFDLDLEQSKFIDYQKLEIQEPIENLKGSEQANHVEVFISDDLVNSCSAGDKVIVTGVVKLKPQKDSNMFNKYMIANHLEKVDQEFEELDITPDEIEEIKQLAKKEDIYELLAQSIAPKIYGHDIVKQAITLQMFGGVKKKVQKQDFRGNIHILLVGDPSTGKSELLRNAATIAPKSIFVSGKSASGAGLTVSAVKDDFGEGGWTLKAGAVVLASGGIAMIDEFDKMDNEDRSTLHEAMAQATVSVSKAGLYAKFRADTSILAAANPKFNRFDKFKNPIEQIDLPFSLLSRFDLYFIIRDVLNRTLDIELGRHIIDVQEAAQKLSEPNTELTKEEMEKIQDTVLPKIDSNIFKKYVAYARQYIRPKLSKEASEKILNYYIDLRDLGRKSESFAATPRQLEGLIRLSEASAKVRLKSTIELEDAQRAINIFKISLEQTAVDMETGKIDIDIITTGTSTSERQFIKRVLNIIKDMTVDGKAVTIAEISETMEKQNISRDKLMDAILKLKKSGELYEPKSGLIKPVEQQPM